MELNESHPGSFCRHHFEDLIAHPIDLHLQGVSLATPSIELPGPRASPPRRGLCRNRLLLNTTQLPRTFYSLYVFIQFTSHRSGLRCSVYHYEVHHHSPPICRSHRRTPFHCRHECTNLRYIICLAHAFSHFASSFSLSFPLQFSYYILYFIYIFWRLNSCERKWVKQFRGFRKFLDNWILSMKLEVKVVSTL